MEVYAATVTTGGEVINEILQGDSITRLRDIADCQVNCCVTSPPYWGLRDYGVDGQIGLEESPNAYVEKMVAVFREVRRVLRDDGTLWLNIGDCYAAERGGTSMPAETLAGGVGGHGQGDALRGRGKGSSPRRNASNIGLKHKDLVGIPWRLAFALQADGWYLRSDIIWHKPNPMPESVTDRPTKAHEYVFLLAKSERYYYDAAAIRERSAVSGLTGGCYAPPGQEPHSNARNRSGNKERKISSEGQDGRVNSHLGYAVPWVDNGLGRNKRTVWSIATEPFSEAHFATFPQALVEPCILAGSPQGGVVLDPFMGAGTTALVALKAGRKFIGVELNPEYIAIAKRRIAPELAQMRLA